MAFTGMDIEETRRLAMQLDVAASQLEALQHQVTLALEATAWTGPSRNRVVDSWNAEHRRHLLQVSADLRDAANEARVSADQQEAVSQ